MRHYIFIGQSTSYQYSDRNLAKVKYTQLKDKGVDAVLALQGTNYYAVSDTNPSLSVKVLKDFNELSKYLVGRFNQD